MIKQRITTLALASVCAAFATSAFADVIETKNGARLIGTVTKIDGTHVVISTDFAGTVTVKQSEVVSVQTDAPLAVRLATGTVSQGKISPAGAAGGIQIGGVDGTVTTTIDKVAATWSPGGTDPAIAALDRAWSYEAAVDIAGKSGNKEQLATGFNVRATLAGVKDKLQFYSAYDRQVTDDVKSADQFKAGVDYQSNFSGKYSWYVRDEGGFDRVKDIELYNVAAFGLGYDIIKKANQTLTGRAGLSFRYEGYQNPATEDVKSAGLDFGLNHEYNFADSKLVNRVSFVPTFEDPGIFRFTHESFYEIPMANPAWKLRLGVSNDYNSEPGPGVDKLDTTYFTRFVLNWK